MGVKIAKLAKKGKKKTSLKDLQGKVIAIDAYNLLFQFLTAIRYKDGTPLKDKQGRVISHLSGLFYRTLNLLALNIRPVYCFDGTHTILKHETIKKRKKIREQAKQKAKKSRERGNIETAQKYAKMSSTLNLNMIEESKKLLEYFGVPFIQSPGEGEAQAAYMTDKGDAWAIVSQDYDALVFGAKRFLKNLAPKKRSKLSDKLEYISLTKMVNCLNITQEQLVDMAILIGTDFFSGVKWVGQKTALKLVKKHGNLESIINSGEKIRGKPIGVEKETIQNLRNIFLEPRIKRNYKELMWNKPRIEDLHSFMIEHHDFSRERIENALNRLI